MALSQTDLVSCLSQIKDPRRTRTRKHLLIDILVMTICAHICSADNWVEVEQWARSREEWLRGFLELPEGVPSHDTFGRVFTILDPTELHGALSGWITNLRGKNERELISIDGKVLRGSKNKGSAIGMVSAWSSRAGIVLGSKKYDKQELHEKRVFEELLDFLYLEGCIVTLDAGGATTDICQKIVDKHSDFVVGLKGNQGKLHDLAKEVFDGALRRKHSQFFALRRSESQNPSHGRQEKRHYEMISVNEIVLAERSFFQGTLDRWPMIKSLGRVKSWRNGVKETRYYMTSLKTTELKEFSQSVRGHWKVENQLHWVLDVAFREDQGRMRIKNGAENAAIVRRIALNILKQDKTSKIGIQAKRRKAGWDPVYLQQLLDFAQV